MFLERSLAPTRNRLHDPEQKKHSEMENDEDQHGEEHGGVLAFFKDLLQHGRSP
jgi:hypothetical protein